MESRKLIFDLFIFYDIIIMKDEKFWDYSQCKIGHPCQNCDDICTFRLVQGVDKKEKKNERTIEEYEGTK